MGIDQDNALFALKKTQYQSEDRAISFLLDKQENGKMEHEFIAYANNEDLCKLCMHGKEDHEFGPGFDFIDYEDEESRPDLPLIEVHKSLSKIN